MNKYLDGWTAFDTVKFLFQLKHDTLSKLEEQVKKLEEDIDWIVNHEVEGILEAQEHFEELDEIYNNAKMLYEALLENISLAVQHEQYKLNLTHLEGGSLIDQDFVGKNAIDETEIILYRYDHEASLEQQKCKKRSIAIWLYKIGEESFAKLVEPSLDVNAVLAEREMEKLKDQKQHYVSDTKNGDDNHSVDFKADDLPDRLYFAYSLYNEIWAKLPDDMNKPTSEELHNYIETKGIDNKSLRDAIIKVSTPNDIKLGGKRKSNLKPFEINTTKKPIGN